MDVPLRTWAEIDLDALRHNLAVFVTAAPPPTCIIGVVKADAYGHGAVAVARCLRAARVETLAVATLEEAIELRDAGIRIPILVMGGYYGPRREGLEEIVARDLTPVVYDAGQIERLATLARFEGYGRVGVHLKVDTGMGRLGAGQEEYAAVLEALARYPEPLGAGSIALFVLLLLAGVYLFYLMSMIFLIPVFWLQSRTGIREVFWSLERLGLRPHGIYRGWMRRLLVSLLPFALLCSYPLEALFGADPLRVALHTAAVIGGATLLTAWMWRRGLRSYSSASS
ncbi:MAG: alanine racemase [Armatimonadetes bacterium]|nr:alanine racemase [Armatimonadota bacterium]